MPAPRPTRRGVLRAVAGVTLGVAASGLISGCTGETAPGPSRPTAPDPDALARADGVDGERAMLAAYDATIAAHPALARALAPIVADHRAHLAALDPTATAAPTGGATPASSGSAAAGGGSSAGGNATASGDSTAAGGATPGGGSPASGGATVTAGATPAPSVPADPAAAVDALTRLETRAAARRLARLADVSPTLARLLACVSASEAVHATVSLPAVPPAKAESATPAASATTAAS